MTLKNLASKVLQLIEQGHYEAGGKSVSLKAAQEVAVSGTQLYRPEKLESLRRIRSEKQTPNIRVVNATTQLAARQIAASGDITLLNFASARNPGGGFLNGAKAQEEDLCRCSGLYPCLLECPEYYDVNRRQKSLLYTDHAIFSPRVPFFKVRGTGEYLEEQFAASVITAPAPNTGPYLKGHPDGRDELEKTFCRRWCNVLCIARDQEVKRLLLGAWGCGAFGGNPNMAARTAAIAIARYGGGFDEIVFAIPGKGKQSRNNLEAFTAVFGGRDVDASL